MCRFRNSARTLAILRDFFVFLILSMQNTGRYIYSIRVDIFQIVYNVSFINNIHSDAL